MTHGRPGAAEGVVAFRLVDLADLADLALAEVRRLGVEHADVRARE